MESLVAELIVRNSTEMNILSVRRNLCLMTKNLSELLKCNSCWPIDDKYAASTPFNLQGYQRFKSVFWKLVEDFEKDHTVYENAYHNAYHEHLSYKEIFTQSHPEYTFTSSFFCFNGFRRMRSIHVHSETAEIAVFRDLYRIESLSLDYCKFSILIVEDCPNLEYISLQGCFNLQKVYLLKVDKLEYVDIDASNMNRLTLPDGNVMLNSCVYNDDHDDYDDVCPDYEFSYESYNNSFDEEFQEDYFEWFENNNYTNLVYSDISNTSSEQSTSSSYEDDSYETKPPSNHLFKVRYIESTSQETYFG